MNEGIVMELPQIDITTLPELADATGIFGSHHTGSPSASSDDTLVFLMTYLYEVLG